MDGRTLQALSKAMTHLVLRNGTVENLHAKGACLDDKTIELSDKVVWTKLVSSRVDLLMQ